MEMKEILIIVALSIILPTLDTVSHINLMVKLYQGAEGIAHPYLATVMLIPFLLNYVVGLITFFRKEKRNPSSSKTYIFAVLNIYPQFEAARIIYLLTKNPSEGKRKKKIFDQDLGLFEALLESVPSVIVLSIISVFGGKQFALEKFLSDHYHTVMAAYIISTISAALGLTNCLRNGVARPIAPGGALDGLLTAKSVLAFLASGLVLVAKGFCIAFTKGLVIGIVLLLFLPLLLSLYSTLNFRDKSSLKILYRQPSLIILPAVSFFTFSRLDISCGSQDSRVSFSRRFTYINTILTTAGYVSWLVWWYFSVVKFHQKWTFPKYILPYTLPFFLIGILLTVLFLHLDKVPRCGPREQLSVYDPVLDKRFLMVDGEVVEAAEDDDETPKDDVESGNKVPLKAPGAPDTTTEIPSDTAKEGNTAGGQTE